MSSISGCTIVRNAVKLKYPLEASIRTYYELCDEVVLAYDPTSEDETEALAKDIALRCPKVRLVPSPWNMKNHEGGTEITIQSNVAVEACTRDWILYVQADEAIHELDYPSIRKAVSDPKANAALFHRRSFLGTLDREIPDYFAPNLLRLFRAGTGFVIGDGMTCGLVQGVRPSVPQDRFRMYNYSRMGDQKEILLRCRYRDNFHIATDEGIEANSQNEFKQRVGPFDPREHPVAIQQHYRELRSSPTLVPQSPITLAILVGPGERENLVRFFWQFRGWPGDVVVFDDMVVDGGSSVLVFLLEKVLGFGPDRYTIIRAPLNGDFAAARNRLQEAARGPWVLVSAPDERWDEGLLRGIVSLVGQLERDGKIICGFPRANFVDGALVNDIPDNRWTETGLLEALDGTNWPPQNPDIQFRLIRKEELWRGRIHEQPVGLSDRPQDVVSLRDVWILHNKSFDRQSRQDAFYRSLGQKRGMPENEKYASEGPPNIREKALDEAIARLPEGRLVVVETGTLRDPRPSARESDGWSTYALARSLAARGHPESRLYSIDIEPTCIETSRSTIPPELHRWISWVADDAAQALETLPEERIDLLYLDSSDDPDQILREFKAAIPKLAPQSLVVVDDTGPYDAGPDGKGTLLLPEAERLGWKIERRDGEQCHMAILSRAFAPTSPKGSPATPTKALGISKVKSRRPLRKERSSR